MRNRTRHIAKVVVLGLMVALALGVRPAAAQESVKVGALLSVSGDLSSFGQQLQRVVQLAVDHINEQGGILGGRTLEVVIADDGTDPAQGVAAAKRLVEVERVSGLVVTSPSSVALPVATEVAIPNQVATVTLASSPRITDLNDDDYVYRMVASDAVQGKVLGDLAARLGYSRIAVMYVDNEYGRDLATEFESTYLESGGVVTARIGFAQGEASYRNLLEQAAADAPQALLLISYPGSGATIVQEAVDGAFFDRFLFSDGMHAQGIFEAIGDPLDGSFGTTATSAGMPGSRVIEALYEERYGPFPQTALFHEAYDAVFLLALAIEKSGGTSGPAIRDALRQLSTLTGVRAMPGEWPKAVQLIREGKDIQYQGTPFPLGFDAAGDLNLSVIGVWTIIDGKIRMISSERVVEGEPLLPLR